jgi:hypothetical protein
MFRCAAMVTARSIPTCSCGLPPRCTAARSTCTRCLPGRCPNTPATPCTARPGASAAPCRWATRNGRRMPMPSSAGGSCRWNVCPSVPKSAPTCTPCCAAETHRGICDRRCRCSASSPADCCHRGCARCSNCMDRARRPPLALVQALGPASVPDGSADVAALAVTLLPRPAAQALPGGRCRETRAVLTGTAMRFSRPPSARPCCRGCIAPTDRNSRRGACPTPACRRR